MKISDARAVITGGASGLGLAVARHLVAAGGKVALLDVQEGPGRAAAAGRNRLGFPNRAESRGAREAMAQRGPTAAADTCIVGTYACLCSD